MAIVSLMFIASCEIENIKEFYFITFLLLKNKVNHSIITLSAILKRSFRIVGHKPRGKMIIFLSLKFTGL